MAKVIRIIAFVNGTPCPIAGEYVKSFDFEAYDGQGYMRSTARIDRAMKFDDAAAAMAFWKRQSKTNPRRPDGRPNRPMTCTTIEIVDA